jgi:cytochrome c biogenesis protein CcmG, thiol:disulfide interchange protein DsbE
VSADPPDEVAPRPRRTALISAVVVGIVMVAFVAILALGEPGGGGEEPSPLIGRAAPAVSGPTLDGDEFDIDDHRGRWVLVNFFAEWCVPCLEEHPDLVAFDEAHGDAGDVQVVSVAFQDRAENLRGFFERNGGEWPVLAEGTGPTAVSWGVTGVPESFLVSPQGIVVHRFVGGVTIDDLESVLAQARGMA